MGALKYVVLIVGVIGVLLGGLWFLQGLGVLNIAPIACVGDCTPIEGGSTGWAVAGFLVLVAGLVAIYFALRWRRA